MMWPQTFVILFVITGMELSRGHHVSLTLFVCPNLILYPIVTSQYQLVSQKFSLKSMVDLKNCIAFCQKMNGFD